MNPINDLEQARLSKDRIPVTREIADRFAAHRMMQEEVRRIEEVRADFIEGVCRQYRNKGEIKLIRPQGHMNLHLFLKEDDGRFHCVGYFDEKRCGVVFVTR